MKRGKKYLAALEKIEPDKKHTLEEAVVEIERDRIREVRRNRRTDDVAGR